MTNKIYKYLFKLLGQETGLLITKYPDDENLLNKLYSDFLIDMSDEATTMRNYITMLIAYAEEKEYYEKCAKLLKLKDMIID